MKNLFALAFLAFLSFSAFAQYDYTYLRTGAVQNSWQTEDCSIDTMLIEVKPKGLYAEVTMTMDFSTRGMNFSNYDSLEIQMMFQLPPDVEVTDMQLWIFGQPEAAGVYDRWEAAQIYEEIVSRRTDPAILYNYTWNDYYSNTTITNLYRFNIFPMLNNLPRKCLITYQVPLRANGSEGFRVPLPMNVANLSNLPIQDFKLRYYPDAEFDEAIFLEEPNLNLQNFGLYQEVDLENFSGGELNLGFPAIRSSTYLGVFDNTTSASDYFQFSIIPDEVFDLNRRGKKTVVLFDYEQHTGSGVTKSSMVNGFLNSFLPKFSDEDSINLLFSDIINNWASPDWLVTDSVTKVWIQDNVSESDISTYTDLGNLLLDALQFIQDNGEMGSIVLISNSNNYADLTTSNNFTSMINTAFANTGVRIHVVDIDDINSSSEHFWTNNQSFYGNRYMFTNLAGINGGEYWSIQNVGYSDALDLATSNLAPTLEAVDIQISRDQGFTHSIYSVGTGLIFPYADQPIGITGVVVGSGDYTVTCSAIEADGTFHQFQESIAENQVYVLDTVTDNIWGGLKQRQMYGIDQTNSIIQSIIQNSKDYRVLSKYTAFLALEPSEGPLPVTNEDPFGEPSVGIDEPIDSDDATFSIHQNPFHDVLTLDAYMPANQEVTVTLFDLKGNLISVLFNGKMTAGNSMNSFDVSYVSAGIYLIRVMDKKGSVLAGLKAIKN